MARIHVLARKEELDGERLPGKVVVVLDVLFATSSIVTALAHGATEVVPALDGEAARAEARRRPDGSCVLSGELGAETIPGFAHPTPLFLAAHGLGGKALIYSTTNGTVAVRRSAGAARVYTAALLNGEAVVQEVERILSGETVLLVCAGSADSLSLEDFYAVGYLASLFARRSGAHDLSDAALAARMLHDGRDAFDCMSQGRIGRLMLSRGLEQEVRFAARKDRFTVVPRLDGGRLVAG